jgi:hypothetical protein
MSQKDKENEMSRFKSILCVAVLTMSVSSTVLGGTIVGARSSRSGTIVGARGGTIVGARSGNIAGTSTAVRPDSSQPTFDFTGFLSRNMGVAIRLFMESSLF